MKIKHKALKVLVRRRLVVFDAHTIDELYNLKGFEYDEYNWYMYNKLIILSLFI